MSTGTGKNRQESVSIGKNQQGIGKNQQESVNMCM